MVKKIKSTSCGPSWCENHLFELNPLKSGLYYKKKLRLRLCPRHNKQDFCRFRAYNTFDKALPVLNRDRKHYTPLFILEEEKVLDFVRQKFYSEHDGRAQANHENLIEKEQEDCSQWTIYEPKHGGEKPYCSVCEMEYSDYMEHIVSHDHKKNLHNTIFTRFIMQIQQKLKNQPSHLNPFVMPPPLLSDSFLSLPEPYKVDITHRKTLEEDFQTIKSINAIPNPAQTFDKLQMQQIESQFVETQTLKELQQLI